MRFGKRVWYCLHFCKSKATKSYNFVAFKGQKGLHVLEILFKKQTTSLDLWFFVLKIEG